MSHQQPEHITSVDQSQLPAQELGEAEIQPYQPPSAEAQEGADLFHDLERKQMDFLNEAGKSLIERISTFLAILPGFSSPIA